MTPSQRSLQRRVFLSSRHLGHFFLDPEVDGYFLIHGLAAYVP